MKSNKNEANNRERGRGTEKEKEEYCGRKRSEIEERVRVTQLKRKIESYSHTERDKTI